MNHSTETVEEPYFAVRKNYVGEDLGEPLWVDMPSPASAGLTVGPPLRTLLGHV